MLNKIVQKKNLILIIYTIVLIAFWIVALIFGNTENKMLILVLSLILPFVIYGFVRLMYKIVSINASFKIMYFFYYFFLIIGWIGTVMVIAKFINGFPNGFSPTLGVCGALITATLDSAKKNIEFGSNK